LSTILSTSIPKILTPDGIVPPDQHASRIVGELTRLLIAERAIDSDHLQEVIDRSSDGSPKAQARMVERIKCQRTRALIYIHLTPGKRGKFAISTAEFIGFDPDRDAAINPDDPVPERPWLAVAFAHHEGKGRGQYDLTKGLLALITHHALQRLVQRFEARTADDLATSAKLVWGVLWKAAGNGEDGLTALYEPPPQGWHIPFGEGGALVLGRHSGRKVLVLKTVLGPGMADDAEAA
jgi:hypothetical protein